MRRLLPLLLLLLALPAAAGLFDRRPPAELGAATNAGDFLPVREAFRLELLEASPERVRLRFINADGYYLYRHRFAFAAEPAEVPLGEAQLPPGEAKHDQYFGDVEVYHGITDVELPLKTPHAAPYTLRVTYQGCADKGLCYPPETERLSIGGAPAASAPANWDWQSIALFFLAGLGLTFTPCVLPMLPILSGVVLRGQPGGARALALSLAYVVPMAASFAVLGALMGLFGASLNLQARLQSAPVLVPFAAFFVLFALAMFGVFELRLPAFLRGRLDHLASNARGGSLLGAAALGVLSSLLVSPCVSAPLAGALLYIGASGDALGGGLKLFALGLGMGAPLVLFAVGGGALLPKSGAWMLAVRNAFGVLLLAVAVWLLERLLPGPLALALWGALAVGVALWLGALEFTVKSARSRLAQLLGLALLVYGLCAWVGALRGESDPLRPLGRPGSTLLQAGTLQQGWTTLSDPAALQAELQRAAASGQPLLLDWYADWCISCKVMEREVFAEPQILERFAGWRLLRFDVTDSTPAQRALLDRYRLFGPPAMLFFDHRGEELSDQRVVGEMDLAAFSAHMDAVNARR